MKMAEHLFLRHVEEGFYNSVKYSNVDVNTKDASGNSGIHLAAAGANVEIIKLLLELGGNINILNKNNETALHIAIYTRDLDFIRFLISYGCDLNAQSFDGRTPLHIASYLGYEDVCRLLMNEKADIAILDKQERSAKMVAKNDTIQNLFI